MTDRATPNLFVLGAPKCGSTTAHHVLAQHPSIWMSERKEAHYLCPEFQASTSPIRTRAEYHALFAPGEGLAFRGESTPWYLYSESARSQIHHHYPEARFVVILRDPAAMLHALHGELYFQGMDSIASFEEALDAGRRDRPRSEHWRKWDYRSWGDYATHLERWFEAFPRERFHVLFLDDLKADPEGEARKLHDFLGLPHAPTTVEKTNVAKTLRSGRLAKAMRSKGSPVRRAGKLLPAPARRRLGRLAWEWNVQRGRRAPLEPALRASLTRELAPSVVRLEALLDTPLASWRGAPETEAP
ncbi:MAG: sulfotransferase [Myxococcota bacterium]